MAAFETVSKVLIRPLNNTSMIDYRTVRLPTDRPEDADSFEPRDNREPRNPISLWMAYFNLIRAGFGAGMLGLPLAVSQAGIILGTFMMIFIGLLITYMHWTLLHCLNEISRQLKIPHISYRYGFRIALLHGPEVCHSLGHHGPSIIATFMLMSQLGICTVFVAFTSDSLKDFCYFYHLHNLILATFSDNYNVNQYFDPMIKLRLSLLWKLLLKRWSERRPEYFIYLIFLFFINPNKLMDWTDVNYALLALLLPYLILAFFMKTLKIVSYVSLLGNVFNLVGLILVFYQIFRDPRKEISAAVINGMSLLFALGVMLFNMTAVSVILSLDKALKNPKVMSTKSGVINVGMLIPLVVATVFSVTGYWSFGTMEENILRSLPFDDAVSLIAISLYLAAVAFAYPIQSFPAIQMVLEIAKNNYSIESPSDATLKILETSTRLTFVLVTFFVCYLIPFQAPIVAFVGHLCTTLLALVFPALMELCIRYPNDYGKFKIYLIKNLCIIFVGTITWASGIVLGGYLIYIRVLSLYSPNVMDLD